MRSIKYEIRNEDDSCRVHTHTESEIKCAKKMGPINSPDCQYQHSSTTPLIWIPKYSMLTLPLIIGEEATYDSNDP